MTCHALISAKWVRILPRFIAFPELEPQLAVICYIGHTYLLIIMNIFHGVVLSLLFIVLSGLNGPGDGNPQDDSVRSGVLKEHMNLEIKPGDDFFEYVNGTWLNETEIPSNRSSYGVGYIVNEKLQEDVRAIIEESAAADHKEGADEQKVGALFASYTDSEKRDALGLMPLQKELDRIDALNEHKDLAAYFAHGAKMGYGKPFSIFVMADMKDPTKYSLYVIQSGLGLPDREYYFQEDERSVALRKQYVEHIAAIMEMAGQGESVEAAEKIMALETTLAAQHMKKEKMRDMKALYNAFSVPETEALMPDFDWSAYLEVAGVADIDQLIITGADYLSALNGIIQETEMDTWKSYLRWRVIDVNATYLTQEIDQQNFSFFGTALSGVPKQQEQWRRGVSVVNANLGEVVGKVYVKKHFPPEAKERMKVLVDNLLKAYEVSINELEWMSEETKVEALDKLSKFTTKIGYPDIWKNYDALEIKEGDLFGNIERSRIFRYQTQMDKLGGPIQKHEWGLNPQTLNAYYNPTQNEIVFPAAILQAPFFDLSADDAVNYGAIGHIIGHEIGHGFDDKGSTFDGDGALRNWWTDTDRTEFEKRTEKLVEQYDNYQVFDDLNVNGTFTLGENIGDLGGLTIALKAYQMSLNGKEAPELDGFSGIQRVFLGFGQTQRQKAREETLRRLVQTDPHSPKRFRCNGVVRNVPEFYEAFDVQPGDELYLAPEDRVKIW